MKLDRAQTMITQNWNDCICLLGDGASYKDVHIEDLMAGGGKWWRLKIHEGEHGEHIQDYSIAPHLSGCMLGFSKMLMQASFQYLIEIGALVLYTDTDSIIIMATPEQCELYKKMFVPSVNSVWRYGIRIRGCPGNYDWSQLICLCREVL